MALVSEMTEEIKGLGGVENNLPVLNTWFRHHKRRLRTPVTQVKTYPGADVNSDHVPVISTIRLKLKKVLKSKPKGNYNTELLGRDEVITQNFRVEVQNRLQSLQQKYDEFAEDK